MQDAEGPFAQACAYSRRPCGLVLTHWPDSRAGELWPLQGDVRRFAQLVDRNVLRIPIAVRWPRGWRRRFA